MDIGADEFQVIMKGVPTLSEWGIIFLGLMLVFIAMKSKTIKS